MAEERFVTDGATTHRPVTASDQTYDALNGSGANTRPAWVDAEPDPDAEAARFTGSSWFQTTAFATT